MEIEDRIASAVKLMENQYGRDIYDFHTEDYVRYALIDGDEPQALVDEVAFENKLTRRQGTLAHDHIESLVAYWRELMVKTLGADYAAQVSDDEILEWLKKGEEPKPVTDDDADLLINDLAAFIEDRL